MCASKYARDSSSEMLMRENTSCCCTRLISICFSNALRSPGIVRPSCFNAAWNFSSVSSLFSLRMFARMPLNCSSLILSPSSRPRCTSSSSSMALTMTRGVTSSSILRSATSFCRSAAVMFGLLARSAVTCSCSTSVLVRISPLTFTSTCSMTSARRPDDRQPEHQPEGPESTQSHTLHRFTQCNRLTAQGSGLRAQAQDSALPDARDVLTTLSEWPGRHNMQCFRSRYHSMLAIEAWDLREAPEP